MCGDFNCGCFTNNMHKEEKKTSVNVWYKYVCMKDIATWLFSRIVIFA